VPGRIPPPVMQDQIVDPFLPPHQKRAGADPAPCGSSTAIMLLVPLPFRIHAGMLSFSFFFPPPFFCREGQSDFLPFFFSCRCAVSFRRILALFLTKKRYLLFLLPLHLATQDARKAPFPFFFFCFLVSHRNDNCSLLPLGEIGIG